MKNHNWEHGLQQGKVKEYSFYPQAATLLEHEPSLPIELPEIELEAEQQEEKEGTQSSSTTTTFSLTIGGLTLGAVLGVAGATAFAPATSCPAPVVSEQSAKTTAPIAAPAVPKNETVSSPAASSATTPEPVSTGPADGTR